MFQKVAKWIVLIWLMGLWPLAGCVRLNPHASTMATPPLVTVPCHEQLLEEMQRRYQATQSLMLSVDVSIVGLNLGDNQSPRREPMSGYILMREPDNLRVILFAPIAHIRVFDMVSNREGYRIAIPAKRRYIVGKNSESPSVASGIGTIQPWVVRDALRIPALGQKETTSFIIMEDLATTDKNGKATKHQELLLSVHRISEDTKRIVTVRTIRFDGASHLPIEQDMYGPDGHLTTKVSYRSYRTIDDVPYPTALTITRPREKLQFVLRVNSQSFNRALGDDQFELAFPESATIEQVP